MRIRTSRLASAAILSASLLLAACDGGTAEIETENVAIEEIGNDFDTAVGNDASAVEAAGAADANAVIGAPVVGGTPTTIGVGVPGTTQTTTGTVPANDGTGGTTAGGDTGGNVADEDTVGM